MKKKLVCNIRAFFTPVECALDYKYCFVRINSRENKKIIRIKEQKKLVKISNYVFFFSIIFKSNLSTTMDIFSNSGPKSVLNLNFDVLI